MKIKQDLDELRSRFPDCMIAVFADISTGMVLSVSHRADLHQEHLDALCATGADVLRGDASFAIKSSLVGDQNAEIVEALLLNPNEVGLFLCAPDLGADALCCACRPNIDFDQFIGSARATFQAMLDSLAERKAG